MSVTILRNVRVFDGGGLTAPSVVVVRDDVIASVADEAAGEGALADPPADADTVDGDGATLLPGLVDAHVHLSARADLGALAQHGVTTGFDMAS
jgi:imidazolonepropionase-like amidohydrolase